MTDYDTNAVSNRQALCEIKHTWDCGGSLWSLLTAATVNDGTDADLVLGENGVDWFIMDLGLDSSDDRRNETLTAV